MSSRRRFCAPNRDGAERYSAGDGDNKEFVAGESTKEAVKTIAQGMPGVPVTSRVQFFCARLRVHRAPGIPLRPPGFRARLLARPGRAASREIFGCLKILPSCLRTQGPITPGVGK
jgi:hypothetical protein